MFKLHLLWHFFVRTFLCSIKYEFCSYFIIYLLFQIVECLMCPLAMRNKYKIIWTTYEFTCQWEIDITMLIIKYWIMCKLKVALKQHSSPLYINIVKINVFMNKWFQKWHCDSGCYSRLTSGPYFSYFSLPFDSEPYFSLLFNKTALLSLLLGESYCQIK